MPKLIATVTIVPPEGTSESMLESLRSEIEWAMQSMIQDWRMDPSLDVIVEK